MRLDPRTYACLVVGFCAAGCELDEGPLGPDTCGVDGSDASFPFACTFDDAGFAEHCYCTGSPDGGRAGTVDGGGAGVIDAHVPPPAPRISLRWDGDDLVLKLLTGAEYGPYLFGLVELGAAESGWQGEDCIEGVTNGADVCHSVPENGELRLVHVDFPDQVEDGKTLLNARLALGITYVLIRDTEVDKACWTWGHGPYFYKDPPLGCDEIEPVTE